MSLNNFSTPPYTKFMDDSKLQGQGIWNCYIWIFLALIFAIINVDFSETALKSPFWFLQYFLFGLLLFSLWANNKFDLRGKIKVPREIAPIVFIIFSWILGMIVELTLTLTGEGIGGNHQYTFPSFILSQGIYIPLALVSLFGIRKLSLNFKQLFFFAGGMGLVEGLIFRPVILTSILSPFFILSPIVIAYFVTTYAIFLALPLLLIHEKLLHKRPPQRRSYLLLVLYGFIAGFLIYIFWGVVYGPLAESIFNFPPGADEIIP